LNGTPNAINCLLAQRAFEDFRVVPPGTGIVHQVNLEYLAPVVQLRDQYGSARCTPIPWSAPIPTPR
jgi:aconitase A